MHQLIQYVSERETVAQQLTNVTFFSTTAALWLRRTCESYLSLTVHCIDNWDLRGFYVQTGFFPDPTIERAVSVCKNMLLI